MELADGLFRQHHREILATLVRLLGPRHFALAEDVAQEALVRALEVWPFSGVPSNPKAWLIQTAKHKAIDRLRRERRLEPGIEDSVAALFERPAAEYRDDLLAMIFLCCHPSLTIENQVALTLQAVCGLNAREISQAFLLPESTVAQRLVRAKRALAGQTFALPARPAERAGAVLAVIYLLFNEGHASVRIDLCEEAIALAREFAAHPSTRGPAVDALLALMLFQSSRLDAREPMLTLAEQDRSRWNRARIAEAYALFERSLQGDVLTRYHVEAAIAAEHARAPSVAETDWAMIVAQYDRLMALEPGPAAALNRAIAIGLRDGPEAGLVELRRLTGLARHHRYHAALGEFLRRSGQADAARTAWATAEGLAADPRDRAFYAARAPMIKGQP